MANNGIPTILQDRAGALAHYPHARKVAGFIYVSGVSSRRPDNSHEGVRVDADGTIHKDIAAQTRAVIQNIQHILQQTGADLCDLVDLTTFLVEMSDFTGYNAVYNTFFEQDTGPTRTTVAVHQLPHPNLLIEMKAVAVDPAWRETSQL